MIWVTDVNCDVVYISDEWANLTGQAAADAGGTGWLSVVHATDRAVAMSTLVKATAQEKPFSIRYRLHQATGSYLWVVTGAIPSISPGGKFIGFLGTVLETQPASEADGFVGSFRMPDLTPSTMSHAAIDVIADHLLLAHSLAMETGERSVLAGLERCLWDVSQRLAMLRVLGPKKTALN